MFLWEFLPIHPIEHLWAQALMLDNKAWLAISIPVHPKGVRWGWGQRSVRVSQVLPHQTQWQHLHHSIGHLLLYLVMWGLHAAAQPYKIQTARLGALFYAAFQTNLNSDFSHLLLGNNVQNAAWSRTSDLWTRGRSINPDFSETRHLTSLHLMSIVWS